jgi:hypothetical protein
MIGSDVYLVEKKKTTKRTQTSFGKIKKESMEKNR